MMQTRDALRIAQEQQLDLVEVAARVRPPVCRIMDYGRFKYDEAKKTRKAKKAATKIEVKEIKFRPKTAGHDYGFKSRNVRRFLEDGNKVRLVVQFRGREIVHPETGRSILERVVKDCMDICHVEHIPLMEGRRMIMIIAPKANRQANRPKPSTPSPAAAKPRTAAAKTGPVVETKPVVSSTKTSPTAKSKAEPAAKSKAEPAAKSKAAPAAKAPEAKKAASKTKAAAKPAAKAKTAPKAKAAAKSKKAAKPASKST